MREDWQLEEVLFYQNESSKRNTTVTRKVSQALNETTDIMRRN